MNRKTMSRRKFLRLTGLTLGAGALTCAGLGALEAHLEGQDQPETPPGTLYLSRYHHRR